MSFLFVALYGILSGLFDVLPVSSFAHLRVLENMYGVGEELHLLRFLIHLASLGALVFLSLPSINALAREQRILSFPRRKALGERKLTYELRFVKAAIAAIAVSVAVLMAIGTQHYSLLLVGIFCVLNGIVVLVPEYLPFGNKTAKHLTRIDSVIFGLLGGIGVFPGFSGVASMQCYANLRGVDRTKSSNWVLLGMIPALAVIAFFDLVGMFTGGLGAISFLTFLSFVFGAICSFLGTLAGVTLIRFLAAKGSFSGFGYYSIGVGLLTFFLYLTV